MGPVSCVLAKWEGTYLDPTNRARVINDITPPYLDAINKSPERNWRDPARF